MLIDRLKEGFRLLGSAKAGVDQGASDRDLSAYAMPRLNSGRDMGSTISSVRDVRSWMNASLVLTTARATSGV